MMEGGVAGKLSWTSKWVRAHALLPFPHPAAAPATPSTSSDGLSPLSGLALSLSNQHIESDYGTPKRRLSLSTDESGSDENTPAHSLAASRSQLVIQKNVCHTSDLASTAAVDCSEESSSQDGAATVILDGEDARDGIEERRIVYGAFRRDIPTFTEIRPSCPSSGAGSMDCCDDDSATASLDVRRPSLDSDSNLRSISQLADHPSTSNEEQARNSWNSHLSTSKLRVPSMGQANPVMSPSQSSVFAGPEEEWSRDSGYVEYSSNSNSSHSFAHPPAPVFHHGNSKQRPIIRRSSKRNSGGRLSGSEFPPPLTRQSSSDVLAEFMAYNSPAAGLDDTPTQNNSNSAQNQSSSLATLFNSEIVFNQEELQNANTPRKMSAESGVRRAGAAKDTRAGPAGVGRRRRVRSQFPAAEDPYGSTENTSPISSLRLPHIGNGKRASSTFNLTTGEEGRLVNTTSPVKRKRSAFANLTNHTDRGSGSGNPKNKDNDDVDLAELQPPKTLTRCYSEADASVWKSNPDEIVNIFQRDTNIIGDHTRPHALPSTEIANINDMKGVTIDTVASLLRGEFEQEVEEYHVIDCRFPYEFEGGHVRGAQNLYTESSLCSHFLAAPAYHPADPTHSEKRRVLVFYCEYSSKRGPKMCRTLRRLDRDLHGQQYPRLYYPEIYLMVGGYREFYSKYKDLCEPRNYTSMFDEQYTKELQHFEAKSKSWCQTSAATVARRTKSCRARRPLQTFAATICEQRGC